MSWTYYLQAALSLLLLLGIMVAFLKWGKWIRNRQYVSQMKILDRLALDPHVSLVIVEIREHSYVAAIANKDFKLLRKL